VSHRINPDSNDENEEHKEAVLDTNNSHNEKIRKANKLREKKIIGVKERLETQGNIIEPQYFTKLRQVQWITYTSVLHIPPKPN
jgi:hypothetical protein